MDEIIQSGDPRYIPRCEALARECDALIDRLDWIGRVCEDCDERPAARWAYNEADCIGPNMRVCELCHELACERQTGAL